jgi:hypothetical protein
MELTDILTQPVAVATALGGALLQLLGVTWIDPFLSVLFANIGTVFSALSISSFTLASELPWLPEGVLTKLTLVAGGLYVLKLLDRFADQLGDQLDNDDTN